MFQPGWAVRSTAKKRYTPVYKEVIKERLRISAGGYFSLWLQCSVLTHIPPRHSNTDAPEPLREGCKVLPDDLPKVQINLWSPSITDYLLWAGPAATPTSLPREKYLCRAPPGQQIPALSLLSPQELLHFLAEQSFLLWKGWKSTFPCVQAK